MDMDFNNDIEGKTTLQDPESLRRQTELINYSVEKRNTILEKVFGSKVAVLKDKQQEALVAKHFEHELKDYTAFREAQGASLKKFLQESFNRLTGNQARQTGNSLVADTDNFISTTIKSEADLIDLIKTQDSINQAIPNTYLKSRADEQLKKTIDNYYVTLELISTEFHKKIASTTTK
ncbi:MAG: hypothetical protein EAZ85_00360 [Bacteroidetes bacterium]|nr:MAG: hypothetical protein EAZ85_00360 [Bacteroidota bacterium]TAG90329.1 MAG: hypothetical protein EAZ20_04605 [Bacteroidota bacterium]